MAKFSVAMCTYNGASYLREQLDSVAAQTRLPDELVICDDRSGDATVQIIQSFAATSPFPVRLHVNEKNLGSTKNFEQAIGLCEGDVIALADQDDVWRPEKLSRVEAAFAASADVGMVFTDAEVVDENLISSGRCLWNLVGFGPTEQKLVREGRALDVLLPGWTVTGATLSFRARFRELFLPIPTDLAMIHDGWITLMIAAVSGVAFIGEPLVKYRQHERQQIGAPDAAAKLTASPRLRAGNPYPDLINIALRACRRLASKREVFGCEDALAKLEDRLAHMETRANLPDEALHRVPHVLRELLTRRYHRYSKGFSSAAKDLLPAVARKSSA